MSTAIFSSKAARLIANGFKGGFKFSRNFSVLRFTPTHEYLLISGTTGTVGITDYAARTLGDVTLVNLPSVGSTYVAGDSFGSVESVKAASDVYSPVTGKVIEVNEELQNDPGLVNKNPFKDGWFIKLELDSDGLAQSEKLLNEEDYKKTLK
jgi:glycine cleavage system H protein